MKLIYLMTASLLITTGLTARAGDREKAGNGGSAVVCYKPDGKTIESIELFDYWELKKILNTTVDADLGPETLNVEQKIRLFAKRLENVDPQRAKRYLTVSLSILSQLDSILKDGLGTTPIDDDASTIQPQLPCKKELFAMQIREPATGQGRYVIRKELYEHSLVSNTTRAGIILHEVVYRDAIENGAKDSRGTRNYNYLVSSQFKSIVQDVEGYAANAVFANGLIFREFRPIYLPGFPQLLYLRDRPENQAQFKQLKPTFGIAEGSRTLTSDTIVMTNVKEIQYRVSPDGMRVTDLTPNADVKLKAKVFNQWIDAIVPSEDYIGFEFVDVQGKPILRSARFKGAIWNRPLQGDGPTFECRGGYKYLTAYGVGSCENVVSSLEMRTQFGVTVRSKAGTPVYFTREGESVFPGAMTLESPQRLPIADTKIEKTFKGHVGFYFDGVYGGDLSESMVLKMGDYLEPVAHFRAFFTMGIWPGSTGGMHAVDRRFLNPTMSNLSLKVNADNLNNQGMKFCRNLSDGYRIPGTIGLKVDTTIHAESVYVKGQKKVYDLEQDKVVLVTDENVRLIKSIECSGTIIYDIPN